MFQVIRPDQVSYAIDAGIMVFPADGKHWVLKTEYPKLPTKMLFGTIAEKLRVSVNQLQGFCEDPRVLASVLAPHASIEPQEFGIIESKFLEFKKSVAVVPSEFQDVFLKFCKVWGTSSFHIGDELRVFTEDYNRIKVSWDIFRDYGNGNKRKREETAEDNQPHKEPRLENTSEVAPNSTVVTAIASLIARRTEVAEAIHRRKQLDLAKNSPTDEVRRTKLLEAIQKSYSHDTTEDAFYCGVCATPENKASCHFPHTVINKKGIMCVHGKRLQGKVEGGTERNKCTVTNSFCCSIHADAWCLCRVTCESICMSHDCSADTCNCPDECTTRCRQRFCRAHECTRGSCKCTASCVTSCRKECNACQVQDYSKLVRSVYNPSDTYVNYSLIDNCRTCGKFVALLCPNSRLAKYKARRSRINKGKRARSAEKRNKKLNGLSTSADDTSDGGMTEGEEDGEDAHSI